MEYPLVPIGTVQSCFLDCAATPRQPGLCPDTRIALQFDRRLSPEIFDGLAAHSHLWIVYVFHKNTNSDRTMAHLEAGKTFPSKVKPPRRRGKEVPKLGVLGTRTPVSQRHFSPLFLGRFSPVLRRFSAVVLCCLASWRQDGENGRKMAENGRNLGEKRARNSGG